MSFTDYDDIDDEPIRGQGETEEQFIVRLERHWADLAWRQGQGQQDDVH